MKRPLFLPAAALVLAAVAAGITLLRLAGKAAHGLLRPSPSLLSLPPPSSSLCCLHRPRRPASVAIPCAAQRYRSRGRKALESDPKDEGNAKPGFGRESLSLVPFQLIGPKCESEGIGVCGPPSSPAPARPVPIPERGRDAGNGPGKLVERACRMLKKARRKKLERH
jgi:hypothetical protein